MLVKSSSSGPPWIIACQDPLYMGLYMYIQGIFLTQRSNLRSPVLQTDSLLSEPPGKPHLTWRRYPIRGCIYYYLLHLYQSQLAPKLNPLVFTNTRCDSESSGRETRHLDFNLEILIYQMLETAMPWWDLLGPEPYPAVEIPVAGRLPGGYSWSGETRSPCARLVCSPESRRKIQVLPPTEQTLHCKLTLLFRCLFSKGFS